MRCFLAASALALLAACSGSPSPEAPPPTVAASPGNDCAVLAAVARDHYKAKPTDRLRWLTLDGDESHERWQADCDWKKLGFNFAYDEGPTPPPELTNLPHLSFGRPRYDTEGALVRTSLVIEPMAGSGYECRVRSGFAGWTVSECKLVMIS